MPNTGMLDHQAYGRRYARSRVHWMEPWPSQDGYTTVQSSRVAGFSRHLQLLRSLNQPSLAGSRPSSSTPRLSNSLSPFHTSTKPTCGFFFSRDTDNKKRHIGIPPSNLVAWRSLFGAHTHQRRVQTAH